MSKRKQSPYRFQSIAELKKYFSEYLSLEEMEIILLERTKSAKHLEGDSMEMAHLDFLASCAEAMKSASEVKKMAL